MNAERKRLEVQARIQKAAYPFNCIVESRKYRDAMGFVLRDAQNNTVLRQAPIPLRCLDNEQELNALLRDVEIFARRRLTQPNPLAVFLAEVLDLFCPIKHDLHACR